MPSPQRTIVVGAGIVGLSTAWYLARRGREVIVLERGSVLDTASAGNAGLIEEGHLPLPRPGLAAQAVKWMADPAAPLYIPPRWDPALWIWLWRFHGACRAEHVDHVVDASAQLFALSGRCWRELAVEDNLCDGGWLDVFATPRGRADVAAEAAAIARHGYHVEMIPGDELRNRDPAFSADVLGAGHHRGGAWLDPRAAVRDLCRHLTARGVAIREETTATLDLGDGSCGGVITTDGTRLPADEVVVAAGAWSAELLRPTGWQLPLQGGKGYHVDLDPVEPMPRTACVLHESHVAVTPLPDRLRLAGTMEFSGLNLKLVRRRLEMLVEGAQPFLPQVAGRAPRAEWCGLRPCTPDGLPVLGRVPYWTGLYVATGHAKLGLTMGPGSGKVMADLVLDGTSPVDVTAMTPARF